MKHVEYVMVTPAKARIWQKRDREVREKLPPDERARVKNRALRNTTVQAYRDAFLRGEYVPTHEGIAFHENDCILDGQHRIAAIALMPDHMVLEMQVTTGLTWEGFRVMNGGIKRGHADHLNEGTRIVEVARLIATFYGVGSKMGITSSLLQPVIERIRKHHDDLITFAPTVSKTWSSAPVRTAAVISMMSGIDHTYVRGLYRAMVMRDFQTMPPVLLALAKAVDKGQVTASARIDMYARCMVAFDPRNAQMARIQINDARRDVAPLRAMFADLLEPPETDKPEYPPAPPMPKPQKTKSVRPIPQWLLNQQPHPPHQ